MNKYRLLAAFFCALSPLSNAADEINLDEVVVTATRFEQPLKETLSSTTVITQEDIKNSQAPDVPTILRSVAGVEISQAGGMGKATSLFLRGSNSTQVLVLIDGVRFNSATLGTTAIQDIMLDQVERIEVVRGNVSSLYGSEAIGGVVQIFTKKGNGALRMNASAGVGTLGTQRLSAGFGGAMDKTDFHLQVSSFSTNGVSALNPALNPKANPDADGYRNASVSANVRHALNADHSLSANFFNSLGDNQYDSEYGPNNVANSNTQKISIVSIASEDRVTDAWQSNLQYAQGVDEYHDYADGLPVSYSPGVLSSLFKTTHQQLTWQNKLQLGSTGHVLLGAENLMQKVDKDVDFAVTQRTINSLFAGYTGNYGSNQVQTNFRQDNNSQFGSANTGLIGYGYAFNEVWRATTSYSTGFRAPTFNDLYSPSGGNVNIKPERANDIEAGIHYSMDKQQMDVVYFDNRTQDLIVWAAPSYLAANISQARIDGVEISYSDQFGDTGVKTAVTIQNPRDLSNNKALVRRANTHSSVAATHKLGALLLGAEWLYSDSRTDNGKTLADYHVFNVTAAYALNKGLKLALRADNLTDQNDSNAYGYNPLGRTLFVSMSYQQ
ncbi:MAG: TonB-dependent receptor domain-containing protein [Gallionellaceae bacterium]